MFDGNAQQRISLSDEEIDRYLAMLIREKAKRWKSLNKVPSYNEVLNIFLAMILEALLNADDPWPITTLSEKLNKNYGTLRRKIRSLNIQLEWAQTTS